MARHYNTSYYDYLQYLSSSIHFFFLASLFLFLTLTWYINYESRFDDMDRVKFLLMAFPLLVVYWLSSDVGDWASLVWSLPDKDSVHKVGGSPIGVAIVLMFLMFTISHHASLKKKWFLV